MKNKFFRSFVKKLSDKRGFAGESTTTTLAEAIPTIVESALLELDDGDIIRPLVRNIQFGGTGVVHQTPFITRLTAETETDLANQALDSGGSDETSPSSATVGEHGATVLIKDLARMGSVTDIASASGQLIGQSLVVRRETDLATLFASFTPNQGDANEDVVVADIYGAYKSLREGHAPLPYNMVLSAGQFWGDVGVITLMETTSGKIQSQALGSVQEDIARNGFTGMILGFNVFTSTNIVVTSNNASGACFSRDAIKYVEKQGIKIEVDREIGAGEVGDRITGTGYWGEAILRNGFGVEMQFNEVA